MKVKKDFITNSSSTSYIFAIPEKLNITIEEIEKHLENNQRDYPENALLTLNEVYDECLDIIEHLKKGETVFQENFTYQSYGVIVDYLYNQNLDLGEIDTDDGGSHINPVNMKKIEELILAISLYDNQDIIEKIINEKGKVKNEK